jgi:hypothetical protein
MPVTSNLVVVSVVALRCLSITARQVNEGSATWHVIKADRLTDATTSPAMLLPTSNEATTANVNPVTYSFKQCEAFTLR